MQRRGDAEERGVECSELRVESGEKGLQTSLARVCDAFGRMPKASTGG